MGIGCGSGNIYFGPDPLRVGTRVLNSLPDPTLMTLYAYQRYLKEVASGELEMLEYETVSK